MEDRSSAGLAVVDEVPSATVVLIEDDEDIREIVAEVLRAEGYAVFTARDGGEGLELVRRLGGPRVSLILLDFMMPVLDGSQVLSVLKGDAELESIPVVVVSAAARQAPASGFRGIAAWLSKPVDMHALLAAVRGVLGKVERRFAPTPHSAVSLRFLARRMVDVQELDIAIERTLFIDIERVARNLAAAGAQEPAFAGLVELGTSLLRAARDKDIDRARLAVMDIQTYVARAARANRPGT
jgi:two-component system phosphate regulon response regulator PhoB